MQQKCLVKALVFDEAPLTADVLIAFVNLGGLRESSALLVHWLCGKEPRHLWSEIFQAHRAVALEDRMKGVVPDPGFVPEHVLAQAADFLQDFLDVVDRAVVSRKLDACQPEREIRFVSFWILHKRIIANPVPKFVLVPGVPVDGTDHAKRIACGGEENRNRPGLDQSAVVHGLMVVAVEQDQITASQHPACNHFVRGARTVEDEVSFISAEHASRMALRLSGGAFVDEQVSQIHVGVTEIVEKMLSPKCLKKNWPVGDFRKNWPP